MESTRPANAVVSGSDAHLLQWSHSKLLAAQAPFVYNNDTSTQDCQQRFLLSVHTTMMTASANEGKN